MIKPKCPACGKEFGEPDIKWSQTEWYKLQQAELYCPSCKTKLQQEKFALFLASMCLTGLLFFHLSNDTFFSRYLLIGSLLFWIFVLLFKKYKVSKD